MGGGSGFIISSDGLILTNKHVVSDVKASYSVLTNDGNTYPAKVLARDTNQDLAVLKIDATDLPVDPSEAQRLLDRFIVGNAWCAGVFLEEHEPDLAVGRVMFLKPPSPRHKVLRCECVLLALLRCLFGLCHLSLGAHGFGESS